ncbi:MAG: cytochrome c peroxidase [Vicingaceae bacterium]
MNTKLGHKPLLLLFICGSLLFFSCRKKEGCTDPTANNYSASATIDDGSCEYGFVYNPTPYSLDIPDVFKMLIPPFFIDPDNPLTNEGVELGRKLFNDSLIDGFSSATKTRKFSCTTCHKSQYAFGSPDSVPTLMNLSWSNVFKWEGKIQGTVEDLMDFEVSHFMHTDVNLLNAHPQYKQDFKAAFNVDYISTKEVKYAMAQYFRTLMSGNSKFDKFLLGQASLTPQEASGLNIFMDETKGDCFHCHGDPNNPLWTDYKLHNNGLDANPDSGYAVVTKNPNDIGKFKTPTLRNLVYTAPYMHDGRFQTLDEVIEFYSTGLQYSPTIDPLMKKVGQGGAQLSAQEKADLKAFLLTLTDSTFLSNPLYQNPFK